MDIALQSDGFVRGDCGIEPPRFGLEGRMGLWAGGLGDRARGGRWGEVTLPTIGETGLGCRVGSFWAMVSTAFGKSGVLIRDGQKRSPVGGEVPRAFGNLLIAIREGAPHKQAKAIFPNGSCRSLPCLRENKTPAPGDITCSMQGHYACTDVVYVVSEGLLTWFFGTEN